MNATATGIVVDNFPAAHRSLRIAVVTETYPPEVNGVARTMACIVEGLHRRNHDLQLIRPRQGEGDTPGRSRRLDEVLTPGLPIPRYPSLRMGVPSKRSLVRMWSLQRPDVVHIATEGPLGWSALQAARTLKLPTCSDFRTNFHAYSRHYGVGWLAKPIIAYLRKFHNATQCTMVPTDALRRALSAAGFERLAVVMRGVDVELFTPQRRSEALRAHWGARPEDLVVVHVGRIASEKNLGTLMQAFAAIAQRNARARLVLVGQGPLRAELEARYPGVVFAGERAREDLATHYASGDLFLFPSVTETFGNVTPEAMASGLPVVAYDYAAAGELIRSGVNGAVVPVGDTRQFIGKALELAGAPALRRTMGAEARNTALDLAWDAIVEHFERVLLTVIRERDVERAPAASKLARQIS